MTMVTYLIKRVALVLSAAVFFSTASSLNATTIGLWTFDSLAGGTVVEDQVGSNDLTVNNSVSLIPSTAGILGTGFGNAGLFGDTNNDSLNGATDSYAFGTSAFSYTGWVNVVNQQTSGTGNALYRYVVENGKHNVGGVNLLIGPTNKSFRGKLGFDVKGNGANNLTVFSDTRIDDSNWHWFAAVTDGSAMSLYVDGVLQGGSASYGAATTATPNPGRIFKVGKALDGSVDQLAVHNTALTGVLDGNNTLISGELYDLWQQQQIPEPSSFVLMMGLGTMTLLRRRSLANC